MNGFLKSRKLLSSGTKVFLSMSIILEACSTEEPARKNAASSADVQKNAANSNSAEANADTYLNAETKPPVTGDELDSLLLRTNGLRVGLQDYSRSKSPVVSYFIPEKADYVQVMRCHADAVIRGSLDVLNDVDLGSVSTADETRIYKANDFWNAAMINSSCQLVSGHVDEKELTDNSAPSGSYRYLARACVYADRLVQTESLVGRVCSRQVAMSPSLEGFVNEREAAENEALAQQQKWKEKVETLGAVIGKGAFKLNQALKTCDTQEADRVSRVQRKTALTTLLGTGVSVASRLLDPANAGNSFVEKAKAVWETRTEVQTEGQKVGQVLMWLFTSVQDFPKSCTEAEHIGSDQNTTLLELKAAHEQFALAADAAIAAAANRKLVEK